MAILKFLSIRSKSVKNIQKLNPDNEDAKYTRPERELKTVRPIHSGSSQFYEKAEVQAAPDVPQKLIIAVTSHRGLCHTSVTRHIRKAPNQDSENVKVVCVSDNSRSIVQSLYGKNIILAYNKIGCHLLLLMYPNLLMQFSRVITCSVQEKLCTIHSNHLCHIPLFQSSVWPL